MSADSAARAYKAVVAGLSGAADALRSRDQQRAAELTERLGELDKAMLRAESRAEDTRALVDVLWAAALESLWTESWLTLRPQPDPPPFTPDTGLEAFDAEVERTAAALDDAVRRRRFGLPGR